jgi:uncharacterized membrane protein (UPF0127 family)
MRALPRLVLPLILLSTTFLTVGCAKIETQNAPQNLSSETKHMRIGNTTLTVEVARTEAEHERGLSYRESLEQDRGMLFVFPQKQVPMFWMKAMQFDLDFIWIANNRVVEITERVPKPDRQTPDDKLIRYSPATAVDSVLEVNSGFIQQHRITIGDAVQY